MTNAAVIEVYHISRIYRTREVETTAVEDVSLRLEAGTYLALCGASGSGKSTLLSLMALVDRPSSGELRLFGQDIGAKSDRELAQLRAKHIGIVFQAFHLIPELTVLDNVILRLRYHDDMGAARNREQALRALERVGLANRAKHFPDQLSGGQQQRAAIARALVGNPSILLADEPTGNLDTGNSEAVMELFDTIHASGVCIVLATHEPRYAQRAQRIVQMSDGRVVSVQVK